MATSGRIETTASHNSKFYFAWQQTGQSTSGNYTDIAWQSGLNLSGGAVWYSNAVKINNIYIDSSKVFNGATYSNISGNGDHQLTSGTKRIYHNSNGDKNFTASISGWLYSYGDKNASGNWDLTTINRFASITSASNFNDEDNPTITYSNPAGTAVTTLQVCIAEPSGNRDIIVPYRDINKTGTSYTFELTEGERTALRNSTPNANTKTLAFYIRTVINGVDSRSQVNKTLTIINANPVFSNFDYEDTNTTTTALTGNNQKLISGYSNLKATVSTANKAVAQKGASLVNYILIIGSKQTTVAYSSDSNVELNITGVQSGLIKLQAVDSRGNITELTNTADIISYIALVFSNIKFERQDGVGTTCAITGNGTYNNVNFGSLANTIIKVEYRKSVKDSGTWDSWVDITSKFTTSSGTFVNVTVGNTESGFTLGTEYDIEVRVTDRLISQTLVTTVNSGEALIAKNKTKKLVGIGKLPDTTLSKGSLDVAGKIKMSGYEMPGIDSIVDSVVGNEYQLKDFLGENIFPYIAEPISNTYWSGLKFANGLMILWGWVYLDNFSVSTAMGNVFFGRYNESSHVFPEAFISAPAVIRNMNISTERHVWLGANDYNDLVATTHPGGFRVYGSLSTSVWGGVNEIVIGKWK